MSLFKIIQWFNYQCPDDNEYNYSSLSMTCARLNADNELSDNIIFSSHSGFISILQPTPRDMEDHRNENTEIQAIQSSVVYEAKLSDPILGILSGNFFAQ